MRANERTDMALPSCRKSNTEAAEPTRMQPATDAAEPTRAKERKDIEEPRLAKSRTEAEASMLLCGYLGDASGRSSPRAPRTAPRTAPSVTDARRVAGCKLRASFDGTILYSYPERQIYTMRRGHPTSRRTAAASSRSASGSTAAWRKSRESMQAWQGEKVHLPTQLHVTRRSVGLSLSSSDRSRAKSRCSRDGKRCSSTAT